MLLGEEGLKIIKFYRNRMKLFIKLWLIVVPIFILFGIVIARADLTMNNLTMIIAAFLVYPVIYIKIINLNNLKLYYVTEVLFFFFLFFPIILVPLILIKKNFFEFDVLIVFLLIFSASFYLTILSYLKAGSDFVGLNATNKISSRNFIDLSGRIIRFENSEKVSKFDVKFSHRLVKVFIIPLAIIIAYIYIYDLPKQMEFMEIRQRGRAIVMAVVSLIFWILIPVLMGIYYHKYLVLHNYEIAHNIKFRTSFALVEDKFKEYNEKRKKNGLKPKSLFWTFIKDDFKKDI